MLNPVAPVLLQDADSACGTDDRTLRTRFAEAAACRVHITLFIRIFARLADFRLALGHSSQGAGTPDTVFEFVDCANWVF
jgi:hypothetical protein